MKKPAMAVYMPFEEGFKALDRCDSTDKIQHIVLGPVSPMYWFICDDDSWLAFNLKDVTHKIIRAMK